MPWLTTEGASHQIAEGETIVGSGAHAGWRLSSGELAARHFVIERRGSLVTVRPCGVDAVIAINGNQSGAHPVDLRDGDTVDAGTARFLYSSERSGSYPAMSVAPAHLVESRGNQDVRKVIDVSRKLACTYYRTQFVVLETCFWDN